MSELLKEEMSGFLYMYLIAKKDESRRSNVSSFFSKHTILPISDTLLIVGFVFKESTLTVSVDFYYM